MKTLPYKRGRDKEYRIIKRLKNEGWDIVLRSAGSHSPIDIIAIDTDSKVIKLIQSKLNLEESMKKRLETNNIAFNGTYYVEYQVE